MTARFGRIESQEAVTVYGRECLLRAKETAEDLGYRVAVANRYFGIFQSGKIKMRGILRWQVAELRNGRIPLEQLLVSQRLSREIAEYLVPSPACRAAMQLAAIGKPCRPGQRIRFWFVQGEPGVCA